MLMFATGAYGYLVPLEGRVISDSLPAGLEYGIYDVHTGFRINDTLDVIFNGDFATDANGNFSVEIDIRNESSDFTTGTMARITAYVDQGFQEFSGFWNTRVSSLYNPIPAPVIYAAPSYEVNLVESVLFDQNGNMEVSGSGEAVTPFFPYFTLYSQTFSLGSGLVPETITWNIKGNVLGVLTDLGTVSVPCSEEITTIDLSRIKRPTGLTGIMLWPEQTSASNIYQDIWAKIWISEQAFANMVLETTGHSIVPVNTPSGVSFQPDSNTFHYVPMINNENVVEITSDGTLTIDFAGKTASSDVLPGTYVVLINDSLDISIRRQEPAIVIPEPISIVVLAIGIALIIYRSPA